VETTAVEAAAMKATAMEATAMEATTAAHMRRNRRGRERERTRADQSSNRSSLREPFHSLRKFQHLRSPSFNHAPASPEPPIST
jgi:hypothetical protein